MVSHRLADPEQGTGVAMVCTFGDTTDVVWWRELGLTTRGVVGRDGRFVADTPAWLTGEQARSAYAALAGKRVDQARRAMVEMLAASGEMAPRPSADHPSGQVLREGRQPAGDRHQPPVVPAQRGP